MSYFNCTIITFGTWMYFDLFIEEVNARMIGKKYQL